MNLLTVNEAAAMLRVNPVTIRRYIKSGRLPALRVGRQVRIEKEAAEALATPVALAGKPIDVRPFLPRKLSAEDLARRKALFEQIVADRERCNIAPMTTEEFIRIVRVGDDEEQCNGDS